MATKITKVELLARSKAAEEEVNKLTSTICDKDFVINALEKELVQVKDALISTQYTLKDARKVVDTLSSANDSLADRVVSLLSLLKDRTTQAADYESRLRHYEEKSIWTFLKEKLNAKE